MTCPNNSEVHKTLSLCIALARAICFTRSPPSCISKSPRSIRSDQLWRPSASGEGEISKALAMESGSFLDVQPAELKFQFELKKQSSCSLQLANKTDQHVAFKVKTTNPKKYCVRPNAGVVLPRSTCDVTVTMQAQREAPPDLQCKDKFLLQSVLAENGVTAKDITSEMFNKEPGKVVDEFKLRVVYVPANPPSPVPEESEEGSSPRSTTLESAAHNLLTPDSLSRAHEEPSKEKPTEALSIISKLTDEKNKAIQLNQKLRQELELIKKESNKHHGGFSVTFVALVFLISSLIGYIFKKT